MTGYAGTTREHTLRAPSTVQGPGAVRPVLRTTILELAPLPTAPGSARLHADAIAREWELPHLADDCALIVSELVTNACRAAAGITTPRGTPPVRLTLTARPGAIQVEVWDASPDVPCLVPLTPDGLGGRGLHLVAALASSHGVRPAGHGGKTAWALLGPQASPPSPSRKGPRPL